MAKRSLVLLVPVFVAVTAFSTAPASAGNATEAFDCGSNKVTVWLLPQGNPKGFGGIEKDTIPSAGINNGWGLRPSVSTFAAEAHAGISGVGFGTQCTPKGYLPLRLKRVPLVAVKVAARLRCSFPTRPLFRIVTLDNGDKRLDVVLSSKTLVASARLTTATATFGYAKRYCTKTAISIHA
jgi:hypothetical protein